MSSRFLRPCEVVAAPAWWFGMSSEAEDVESNSSANSDDEKYGSNWSGDRSSVERKSPLERGRPLTPGDVSDAAGVPAPRMRPPQRDRTLSPSFRTRVRSAEEIAATAAAVAQQFREWEVRDRAWDRASRQRITDPYEMGWERAGRLVRNDSIGIARFFEGQFRQRASLNAGRLSSQYFWGIHSRMKGALVDEMMPLVLRQFPEWSEDAQYEEAEVMARNNPVYLRQARSIDLLEAVERGCGTKRGDSAR